MATAALIPVVVRDRKGVVWEGQARAVSAINARGAFDVLPVHANFITILKKKLVLHKTDGSKEEMNLDNGVMWVLTNKIEVYVGVSK